MKRLGIDEISKRKGHQNFATVVGDLEKGELMEVIDSHQQDEIIEVLMKQTLEVREGVEEVSVDMWGGFPKVIEKVFPNAVIVTDRFHVMKAVNEELNKIRKQIKFSLKIKGAKWLLLKNKKDLKEEELNTMPIILPDGFILLIMCCKNKKEPSLTSGVPAPNRPSKPFSVDSFSTNSRIFFQSSPKGGFVNI